MTTVCTGFSPAGLSQYGQQFLQTFDRYWPLDVRLLAYTEESVVMPRGECRNLWDCAGARDFYERHRLNGEHCGRVPTAHWKLKERRTGYAWRYDAVKFFKQCLIPEHAARDLPDGEILVWLDADVVSYAPVPASFVEGLLGTAELAYLGRGSYHSEIGFWAVRLGPAGRGFLADLAELYRSDAIFRLAQQHSAFAFDHCRRQAERAELRSRDLTPGGGGHVWFQSPLGYYTDHLKGAQRKNLGYSPERPEAPQ